MVTSALPCTSTQKYGKLGAPLYLDADTSFNPSIRGKASRASLRPSTGRKARDAEKVRDGRRNISHRQGRRGAEI